MIIDAHTHIGKERLFDVTMNPEDLIRTMDRYRVDISIVQPQAGAPDIMRNHEEIAELALKHPGRFFGLACFNPVTEDEAGYFRDVEWAIRDLGFKGIKLHTNGHTVSPLNPYSLKVFEAGAKWNIPVMVHTGTGIPQALPSLVMPIARRYPNLKIVLAHAGGGTLSAEAVVVATECPNIYLETSWVYPGALVSMVRQVGAQRVMFGSDVYENVSPFLNMYQESGLSKEELELCLGQTANDVFQLGV